MEAPNPNNGKNKPGNQPSPTKAASAAAPITSAKGLATPPPSTPASVKTAPGAGTPAKPPAGPSTLAKLPPLFRGVDWITMLFAFGVVWVMHFLTLAPEVTLQDSGELCTGAFYAGIPHPPGYPFWTIYAFFWTKLLPIGNVAWRVEVGESTAAALACGLVALMVSRSSSMLIEGISDLKGISRKSENLISLVCGASAGILLGAGRTMWSESVAINRISLFGVPWVMIALLCLLRWIYAPHQRRYLLCAWFVFGLCGTIHQTLLCAALGIEAAIAVTRPRLGRTFFFGNSTIFLCGCLANFTGWQSLLKDSAPMFQNLCIGLGVISIALYIWFVFLTRAGFLELCRDAALLAGCLLLVYALSQGWSNPRGGLAFTLLGLASWGAFVTLIVKTRKLGLEWPVGIICGVLFGLGIAFYLYEPIAGMTNPPMEWGYPRTVDGFKHALSRGQYEKALPTDLFSADGRTKFIMQLGQLAGGIAEEFNWVLIFVALVPLLFYFKMQKRERCWMTTLTGIYLCIGILLVIVMNPQDDRGSVDLHRVFFASSHGIVAIMLGCGMALSMAYMLTHYRTFRIPAIFVGLATLVPAAFTLYYGMCDIVLGGGGAGVPRFNWILLFFLILTAALVMAALAGYLFVRSSGDPSPTSADQKMYTLVLGSLAALCVCAAAYIAFIKPEDHLTMKQISDNASKLLGMSVSSLPTIAGVMLIGIMVAFVGGLLVFRNRAPLMITLGLFALMPVTSMMSHWAASEQRGHWFGYWFGHDMFTPPFKGPDGKLTYDPQLREAAMKGTNGNLVYPEMTRDAILYGGTDPGRFNPTYMIFCESFISHSQQPRQDQHFDRRDVYIITQNALADATYMEYVRAQYNRSAQKDPPFFSEWLRSDDDHRDNYTNGLASTVYKWLDVPFTKLGARVEARRRAEGVYPPREIHIASTEDIGRSYDFYQMDLQRRAEHDQNAQLVARDGPLLKGGEATRTADGKLQVSGTISVMALNGYLTKIIFDANPSNEFFVEESFPLDWMFPYLSPFGVIMKINRQPLAEITPEMCERDHKFWSDYSERLIGNWITDSTTVKEIVEFVDKVHVRRDFNGFTGDRRFIRDDTALKSFSKLRSAIGGIYAWRCRLLGGVPTEARYASTGDNRERMLKEADFAYKQSFAYCPYSPEVVSRYVQLLMASGRIDDAILITRTSLGLDPNNGYLANLLNELMGSRNGVAPARQGAPVASTTQGQISLDELEKKFQADPSDFHSGFMLAQSYLQMQQMNKAFDVLDQIVTNPKASPDIVLVIRDAYVKLNNFPKLLAAQQRLTIIASNIPENWYDLASVEALVNTDQAMQHLKRAIDESYARLATNSGAVNLAARARTDTNFAGLGSLPAFQQLVAPK